MSTHRRTQQSKRLRAQRKTNPTLRDYTCRWCGKPIHNTKRPAVFHTRLDGTTWAEHVACRPGN